MERICTVYWQADRWSLQQFLYVKRLPDLLTLLPKLYITRYEISRLLPGFTFGG